MLVTDNGGFSIANYQYTLDLVGNRTQVVELSGRTVDYTYDNLYRLTNELIGNAPSGPVGDVSYIYDAVGNRLDRTSTLLGIDNRTFSYDGNDRISGDVFNDNGNTTLSDGDTDEYDFKNWLIMRTKSDGTIIDIVYDGAGNRVSKTVTPSVGLPVTTQFLVDTNNLTGFAQVLEEIESGAVKRVYTYVLDLISMDQDNGGQFELSFYVYDGLGSVRVLTDTSSAVTDSYDYDAFGNVLDQTGIGTSNDYLFTGEFLDGDLTLYYFRTRYLDAGTGRFHTMDSFEGFLRSPLSLHKYLYAHANPITIVDPGGNFSLTEISIAAAIVGVLAGITVPNIRGLSNDLDEATFGERFGACLWKNGGAFALGAVTLALGIQIGVEPLPKSAAEMAKSRLFGQKVSDTTTRLSRFNATFNSWIRKALKAPRGQVKVFRGFQIGGRALSALRPLTNIAGSFAAGFAVGLVPGCAIVAANSDN